MDLIFERGDRQAPAGHALIYFRPDANSLLATYVIVPPIRFDLSRFMPPIFQGAMQGINLQETIVGTPIPPIPEEVPSVDYLVALANRRHDDLVFAGGTMSSDPMRLAADAAEAARVYGDLYHAETPMEQAGAPSAEAKPIDFEAARFALMSEVEQLNELTHMTGRLRDSLSVGSGDVDLERQMRSLAAAMPAKYRAGTLIDAALIPGERGQKLAGLHLERCYKLFNEEYLDLERIDREIETLQQ